MYKDYNQKKIQYEIYIHVLCYTDKMLAIITFKVC